MSTTKPLAQRITRGPIHQFKRTLTGEHGFPICDMRNDEIPDHELVANVQLIAETWEVTHETGKTPRELVAALKEINDIIFAAGAGLGTNNYFKIREICTSIIFKKQNQ